MHSPVWHVAWSTLQGPGMTGVRGGFLVVVVVRGGGVTGEIGRFVSKTNLWLNSTTAQFEILDMTRTTDVNHASPSQYSMLQPTMLRPADQSSWSHSPQFVSSLMSRQSGLLSHRYSIRIHVPSPHLCSSGMQGLMEGVTKRCRWRRRGGEVCVLKDQRHASQDYSRGKTLH